MSAPWAKAFASVAFGALALALTTSSLAEGRLDAFRRLRAEGLAAVKAGDMTAAQARVSEAVTTMPSHPGAILLLARLKAADDPVAAVALLARHAAMGLIHNASADPALKALADRPDYAPVAARVAANRKPVGTLKPVADLAGPVLAESVAFDAKTGRLLVSQIHARRIVAVGKDGKVSNFTAPADDVWGVFGIAIDAKRRALWALTAATPQAKGVAAADLGATALLRIDLDTGRILARHAPPADGTKRQLGDLTVGPDGAVYASNSLGSEIWRLEPGAKALDRLVSSPEHGSPQGMALAADGRRLLVADYSSGLHVIDLASGAVSPVAIPPDVTLLGVDGLTRAGQTLIAVQNGVAPQRLLRLWPTPDGKRLTRVETLVASLPDLDEPTSGAMRGDDFVFVARSQWTDFGDDGLKTSEPKAARVTAIKVAHQRRISTRRPPQLMRISPQPWPEPSMIDLVIEARRHDIGNFEVGRILPFHAHRMVGPFTFLDHMGPAEFAPGFPKSADVRPHPHIGLSTLTYLFQGEITHRDSVGSLAEIKPGEVNWMTAGSGITHSERFETLRRQGGKMDGMQAWIALPQEFEEVDPSFSHHRGSDELPYYESGGLKARLIAGEAFGAKTNVPVYSPLFYVHWELAAGTTAGLPAEYSERAAYVASGRVEVDGRELSALQMAVFAPGETIVFKALEPSTVMLLGGEPVGPRFMEWNFVSSSKDRLEQAKVDWKAGRMKLPDLDHDEFIPLPEAKPAPPQPL